MPKPPPPPPPSPPPPHDPYSLHSLLWMGSSCSAQTPPHACPNPFRKPPPSPPTPPPSLLYMESSCGPPVRAQTPSPPHRPHRPHPHPARPLLPPLTAVRRGARYRLEDLGLGQASQGLGLATYHPRGAFASGGEAHHRAKANQNFGPQPSGKGAAGRYIRARLFLRSTWLRVATAGLLGSLGLPLEVR